MSTPVKRWDWALAATIAWAVIAGGGLLYLGAHAARPGASGTASSLWPATTLMRHEMSRPTLLIFVHPRCPCSRASLVELVRILARCRGRIACRAIVYRPASSAPDWGRSAIAGAFSAIPDLRIVPDEGGVEARRFGVATSGHVLLYAADGRLLFSGGITPARGHQGNSYGSNALIALIGGTPSEPGRCSPVFGCPIAREGEVIR